MEISIHILRVTSLDVNMWWICALLLYPWNDVLSQSLKEDSVSLQCGLGYGSKRKSVFLAGNLVCFSHTSSFTGPTHAISKLSFGHYMERKLCQISCSCRRLSMCANLISSRKLPLLSRTNFKAQQKTTIIFKALMEKKLTFTERSPFCLVDSQADNNFSVLYESPYLV